MDNTRVTKEEALERVNDNLETIEGAFGTIKFNKKFFGVFNGISLVSGVVGTGLLIAGGLAVAPIIATGCGLAGTIVSAVGLAKEKHEEEVMCEAEFRNTYIKNKIINKANRVR